MTWFTNLLTALAQREEYRVQRALLLDLIASYDGQQRELKALQQEHLMLRLRYNETLEANIRLAKNLERARLELTQWNTIYGSTGV